MEAPVIYGLLIPFVGTSLGSACVFFLKKGLGNRVQRGLTGFASVVMVAASIWSLLIPTMEQSAGKEALAFLPAVIGFWAGILFLLGDLILKSGGYKSAKKSLLGYAVFSLWMVGTYIPMYFMVEDSWASFAASFGEEYADQVMAVMPMWSIILVIAGIFVFAIFGGLLGKALLKKHFAKAGIA